MSGQQITWDDESKTTTPGVKWDPPVMRAATPQEERQFIHGTPEYRQRIIKDLAEHGLTFLPTMAGTLGGLAGGAIGGVAGGAPSVPGAALGAALGGASGALTEQIGRRAIFGPSRTTTLGAAGDIGKEAALQSLYELLGLGVGRAFKGAGRMLGGTEKVGGIPMLSSERTGGRVQTQLARFFEHSFPTASVMERFRTTQTAAVEAEADKLVQTISNIQGTPEQKGLLIRQAVEEARTRMSKEVSQAYDAIDQMSKSRRVRVPYTKQITSSIVSESGQPLTYSKTAYKAALQGGAPVRPTAIRRAAGGILVELQKQRALLDPAEVESLMKYLKGIRNSTDNIEFGAADKARGTLLNLTRKYEGILGNRKTYILNQLEEGIDRDMADAAQRSGISGLDTQLKVARTLSREQHQIFEQRLVQKVLEGGNPETTAKVFRDAGLQELRDIGGIITPQQRRIIGASVMEDIMRSTREAQQAPVRGLTPRVPRFRGDVFSKAINDLGEERGNLIFGSAWDSVKRFQNVVERIRPSEGDWMSFHNYAYVAAGAGLVTGHVGLPLAASTAGQALVQRQVAKIMTRPEGAMAAANLMAAIARQTPRGIDAAVRQFAAASRNAQREEQPGMPKAPVPPGLRSSQPSLTGQSATAPQAPTSKATQASPVLKSAPSRVQDWINEAAKAYGVEPRLLQTIMQKESGYNPFIQDGGDGEIGPMQLTPGARQEIRKKFGYTDEQLRDPRLNTLMGAYWLRQKIDKQGGSIWRGVVAYNGSGSKAEAYGRDAQRIYYSGGWGKPSPLIAGQGVGAAPPAVGPAFGIPGQPPSPVTVGP